MKTGALSDDRERRPRWWCRWVLSLATACACLSAGVRAATGEVRLRLEDMAGRTLGNRSGVQVTLRSVDAGGLRPAVTRVPDNSGLVVFEASTFADATPPGVGFVVESSLPDSEVRAWLHDPFGAEGTFIAYDAGTQYEFALPTPTAGSAVPEILWSGPASTLRIGLDLGTRVAADFWFIRLIWQLKAPSPAFAGPEFGLLPVLSTEWLMSHDFAVADGGLAVGQTGSVRFQAGAYDHTFLARKESWGGAGPIAYRVFLVNGVWSTELPGKYDRVRREVSVTFDPATVFRDTSAPAWNGAAMREGVPYFPVVQATAWIWHAAGRQGGVAIDWGSGVGASLFHPVQATDQNRLVPVGGSDGVARFRAHVFMGLDYTFQRSTTLRAGSWQDIRSFRAENAPMELADSNAPPGHAFYRLRHP